jgi:BirA family biotin operon repressor/biotin-[acetyl-CoA-carboxylase] ligase
MFIKNNFDEQIIHLLEVDSTNNYAHYLIDNQKDNEQLCGKIIFADFQTQGRGAYQNTWESKRAENLLVSFILCPKILAEKQFVISKITSLALIEFLRENEINAQIKWPNDILVSYKKISGILIENTIQGNKIKYSIVGVGVNINQTLFFEKLNATSIRLLTQKKILNFFKLVKKIWQLIEKYLDLYNTNSDEIHNLYFANLIGTKKFLNYRAGSSEFKAKISGIDEFGRIMLLTENGDEKIFGFKEVELLMSAD